MQLAAFHIKQRDGLKKIRGETVRRKTRHHRHHWLQRVAPTTFTNSQQKNLQSSYLKTKTKNNNPIIAGNGYYFFVSLKHYHILLTEHCWIGTSKTHLIWVHAFAPWNSQTYLKKHWLSMSNFYLGKSSTHGVNHMLLSEPALSHDCHGHR